MTKTPYLKVEISDHPIIPNCKRNVLVRGFQFDDIVEQFFIVTEVEYLTLEGEPFIGLSQPKDRVIMANDKMMMFVLDKDFNYVPNPDAEPDEQDPFKKFLFLPGFQAINMMHSLGVQLDDNLLEYFIHLNDEQLKFFDNL